MKGDQIIMRFFLKHCRFWGNLFIAIAIIGSNIGSAWAGVSYKSLSLALPGENSAPPDIGFQIMGWTVYPLAIALLVLGVYLRCKYKRS